MNSKKISSYEILAGGFNIFMANIGNYLLATFLVICSGIVVLLIGIFLNNALFYKSYDVVKALIQCKDIACIKFINIHQIIPLLKEHLPILLLSILIVFLGITWLVIGYIRFIMRLYDTKNALYLMIYSLDNLYYIPKFLMGGFLFSFLTSIGLLFLIVPGLILMVRLMFWYFCMFDKNAGPIQAQQTSWRITQGNGWMLLGLASLTFLISSFSSLLAGPFVLFVSIIVWPLIFTINFHAYRQLVSVHDSGMTNL